MQYTIIGTAGHVDHGKSSLIKALNGFWGDTTSEEIKQGITIELSFSYLKKDDKTLAFIDVPGHKNLVSTMISGAHGFDTALVVIDINEGVMPQTKEHLEVLNFLQVHRVILALTKVDLANQKNLKEKKHSILTELTAYKNLYIQNIHLISIHDKQSIKNLANTLFSLPKVPRKNRGVFRYYIDRVFSLKGHGTIVTGTVQDGTIQKGQKIWICELNKQVIVKGIQIHESETLEASAHQRAALSLNIPSEKLTKGMLLTQKGYLRGFKKVELYVTCIKTQLLPHNAQVTLHCGSLKKQGNLLHVASQDDLQEGFSTFICKESLFLSYKDKCIISYKGKVIAGAKVLSAIVEPVKNRDKLPLLQALCDEDILKVCDILTRIHKKGFGLVSSYQRFSLSHEEVLKIAKKLQNIFIDSQALTLYPKSTLHSLEQAVKNIYIKNPYALISATSLSLKHSWVSINLAKEALKNLEEKREIVCLDGVFAKQGVKKEEITNTIQTKLLTLIQEGKNSPLAPYNLYDTLDIDRKTGDDALKKLTSSKKVVRLTHNLFVSSQTLSSMMEKFREIIRTEGFIDVQSLKSHFFLSRKYLIAYLEYLDEFDDIHKDGTKRVFR